MRFHGCYRCLDQAGVIGQAQIIIGTKIDHPTGLNLDLPRLRRGDFMLVFQQIPLLQPGLIELKSGV